MQLIYYFPADIIKLNDRNHLLCNVTKWALKAMKGHTMQIVKLFRWAIKLCSNPRDPVKLAALIRNCNCFIAFTEYFFCHVHAI